MKLGLDIGSTTIKCVLLDENDEILYSSYERHLSKIAEMTSKYLKKIADEFKEDEIGITISGSAGLGISEYLNVPFTQEVFSTRTAVQRLNHDTDVVIELGGEDAKILFFTGGFEARMNGSCAGGTGAFIDQMAALLNVTQDDLMQDEKVDGIIHLAAESHVDRSIKDPFTFAQTNVMGPGRPEPAGKRV